MDEFIDRLASFPTICDERTNRVGPGTANPGKEAVRVKQWSLYETNQFLRGTSPR